MSHLNLPPFNAQISTVSGKNYIFDILRKKSVRLTPEEWVRQHVVHYLTSHLGYPHALIKIEAPQKLYNSSCKRRADILIFDNKQGAPLMLIECKASKQALQPPALTQITQYNTTFQAPFLTLTNGIQHLCYQINLQKKEYTILPSIPSFGTLITSPLL